MQDYSLSFTAASLMSFETEQIAQLYSIHNDWKKVENLVVDDNVMQKGTISTRKREFSEIKKRLKDVSNNDLDFISNATTDELKLYCLYLCSKSYRLIFEFISEVIREKYLMFDYFILAVRLTALAGINLTWEYDETNTIHARHIVVDESWKISLDRGLDIFQNYEMNNAFSLSNRLQNFRSCKGFEVTYIKLIS